MRTTRMAFSATFVLMLACVGSLAAAPAPQAGSFTKPKLYPNSKKYRDTGAHPATGRSGSASLMVRALLGKDNKTDLE